jgi:hypothetical protein
MIRLREFSDSFRGTDFTERELKKFYYSVRKSVILRLSGRRSWPALLRLEESCQWPVLQRISDPQLPIYQGADGVLLDRFIRTISEERIMRGQRFSINTVSCWSRLQFIIEERIDLFMQIFDFCRKDITHCEKVAERHMRIKGRRIKNRGRLSRPNTAAGVETLGRTTPVWHLQKRRSTIQPASRNI